MDRPTTCRVRSARCRSAGACGSRRSQLRGDPLEVAGVGHLQQAWIAVDDADAPACRFDGCGAVGPVGAGQRSAQDVGDERLRRLYDEQLVTRDSLHDPLAVDALDGVRDRERRDGAIPAVGERRDDPFHDRVVEQGTGGVVHDDNRGVRRNLGDAQAHGVGAGRTTRDAGAHLAAAELLGEQDRGLLPSGRRRNDDRVDPVRRVEARQALREQRLVAQADERLGPICAEPFPATGRSEDGPDAHLELVRAFAVGLVLAAGFAAVFRAAGFRAAGLAATFFEATFAGFALATVVFLRPFEAPFALDPTSTPSSHSAASSSSMSFAYMSSLARIFFALTNICFSPVERPFSWSRSERLRTTSASSRMSPVFILSRLCLKRRFQFFGICVPPPVSALTTTLTMSSPITFRSPTFSAFSDGTLTVMSLCRILIVRYSRFSPRTSRFSFFTTVPAPWCGYTTLSPTLYKPAPFRPYVTAKPAGFFRRPSRQVYQKPLEMAMFSRKSLLTTGFAKQRSTECQHDGHGTKEDEAAPKAGGARNSADDGRPDQETEVAEDRDRGARRAAAAGAADPAGQAQKRRRGERKPAAGDDEPRERDGGVLSRRRDDEAHGRRDAGEEHARSDGGALQLLGQQPARRHRGCEQTGAQAADRWTGVERALEKQRAPPLQPALDQECDREHGADDEQRARDAHALLRALGRRVGREVEPRRDEHERCDAGEDPRRMGTGAPQQARSDAAAEDADRERGVQSVHDAHPVARLDRGRLRVDRNVEHARSDPDERQRAVQSRNGVREAGKYGGDPERRICDGHESRAEQVGEPACREHRRQRCDRDAEQPDPELGLACPGLPLHRRK